MSGLDHQYHSCWFGSCEMSKVLLAGGQVCFFCPYLPVIIWTGSIDEGEDTLYKYFKSATQTAIDKLLPLHY